MIRKRLLIALSMTVLLLMGCSKETVPSEPESTENDETVDAVTAVSNETENMEIAEVEEAEVAETVEPKYITIDFNGVTETHAEGDSVIPLKWNILSEEDNGIDFADEWYASENLSLPMIGTDWNSFSDENYEYLWEGEDLYIYESGTGNCLYVLHYPTDKWYVNGNNAYLKDGILPVHRL